MALSHEAYASYDALGLAEAISKGEVSPEDALEAAIARADAVETRVRSIPIRLDDRARQSLRDGPPRGPLYGVPFLLKDLGVNLEGTRTTSGCQFFSEYVADHNSTLVERYLEAGLVIFGKSATPEFGLVTSTESAIFGQTHNPWNLEHSAGGSSGGAAAAVAAGILPAAHASDGGGSIRIPASCCGLFGLKPTRARTPMGPNVGEGWSGMSGNHVVSHTVRDSALLLDIASGGAVGDPYSAPANPRPFLDEVGRVPGSLRIAVTTTTFNGVDTHRDCAAAARAAADLCANLGHRVEERGIEVDIPALARATRTIIGGNLLATLEERSAVLGRSCAAGDVEPLTWGMASAAKRRTAAEYAAAVRQVHAVGRQVGQFFEDYDILISPTMARPPARLGILTQSATDTQTYLEELLASVGFTQLMNVAGNPAASVPLGTSTTGLPIGVQFAAGFGNEGLILQLASQVESAAPWTNRRPALTASTG